MICNRHKIGELCIDCLHGKDHNRTRHCIYGKCYSYAIQFAKENKSCYECKHAEGCERRKQLVSANRPLIDLNTHGEDCPEHNKYIIYTKCL